MTIISILITLTFDIILCIKEIPKMLQKKFYRDLLAFSVLLVLGTMLAILKALNKNIPNPSDFIAWIYSPLQGFMKKLLK